MPVLLKNKMENKNSNVISSVKLSSLNELDRLFIIILFPYGNKEFVSIGKQAIFLIE